MDNGVSVVIPAYNAADTLPRAIESVLNQTHKNLELIVVDDASQDDTEELVKKYIQKDSRVRYIKHEENKERSAARNTGIKNARKPFVAFLDADDEWLPEKLEKQLSYLRQKGKNWIGVYSDLTSNVSTQKFSLPAKKRLQKEGGKEVIKTDLLNIGVWGTSTTLLVKKSIISKIGGFDESLNLNEDLEIKIRLLKEGQLAYLDEELTIVHKDKNGGNLPPEYIEKTKNLILKRFKEDIDNFEREGYPISLVQYLRISKGFFRNCKWNKGFEYIYKSLNKISFSKLKFVDIILLEVFSVIKNVVKCIT